MKATFRCPAVYGAVLSLFAILLIPGTSRAQSCPGLGELPINIWGYPAPTLNGPAKICPDGNGSISVNQAFSTYNWSTGESGQTIQISNPGTYTVTVTNAGGCSGTGSMLVQSQPSADPVISQAPYSCNGQLTLDAGAGFNHYVWNDGNLMRINTVDTSRVYSVTVTNAFGCTGTASLAAIVPPPPNISIMGDSSLCNGVSVSLDASPGLVSYTWNTGQHSQNIQVSASGTYTVNAIDAYGCNVTDSITITAHPAAQPQISGMAVICEGTTANLNTTQAFFNYHWSSGETTPGIVAGTAGTYTITVTDLNGCTGTDTETLTLIPPPHPTISSNPYACNGQLTLDAGIGYSTYIWSSNDTTAIITVDNSASYAVTVTNPQGCSGTDTIAVSIPPPPAVGITGLPAICAGDSTILSSTPGFNQYLWSTGSNNPEISVAAEATYSVTVTDQFGCKSSNTFNVAALPLPAPNINGTTQICNTGNALFSVTGPFSAFLWSTGDNTSSISVNSAGIYTVTVTSANGCTGTDTQTLTVGNSLQPQITTLPYTCNGQITLDAGIGYTIYNWNNGNNTQTSIATNNNNYSVTVSDASGCTGTAITMVNIPPAPTVLISGPDSLCNGSTTILQSTPGWSAYSWNTGQATESIAASTFGTYTVTATDAFGCTITDDFILVKAPDLQPDILGQTLICTGDNGTLSLSNTYLQYHWSTGAVTPSITINGGNSYAITVTDAAGCTGTDVLVVTETAAQPPTLSSLPYQCNGQMVLEASSGYNSYAWAGPYGFSANNQQTTVSSNGTYTVVVSDDSGCTSSATLTATIPPQSQVTLSGPTQFCTGSNVNLTATSGYANYAWSNGSSESSSTINTVGTYTVTATDALGCSSTAEAVLSLFPDPVPIITGPLIGCPGASATLTVNGTFTAYSWNNGGNTISITIQPPFSATVTVTDNLGCTGTASAAVSISNPPAPVIVALPYTCNQQITLDAGAGFSYAWAGPNGFTATSQQVSISLSGTYTVSVTNAYGCTGTAAIPVIVPVTPSLSVSGANLICPAETTILSASTGFASYLWSNGQSSSSISVNQTNTYSVTATDNSGCSVSAQFVVGASPQLTLAITGNTTICPGGSVAFSVPDNYANYLWSNGANTASITVFQPGIYTVTVTNTLGCFGTSALNLTQANNPTPVITQQPYHCDGLAALQTGAGFSQYHWSNNNNTSTINISQSGTYTVTVTDLAGCTGSAIIQASIPANPVVSIGGTSTFCLGNSTTLNAVGTGVTYLWSNGASGPSLVVSEEGIYSVITTDTYGCTATGSQAVTVNLPKSTQVSQISCRLEDVGSQSITLDAANGCDSVVTTIITYSPAKPGLALDMTSEIQANIGLLITLEVVGNFAIDSVSFQSPFSLSCTNCLFPTWTAIESGFIQVRAFDTDGCLATGTVQVRVNKHVDIYVPNAFQPGSLGNGLFSVFSGSELSEVRNFRVFDRWGNALFSRDNMPTNEPNAGWDGTFRGQPMQPGVYVYYFEVLLADGSKVKYHGDVTILK